MTTPYGPDAMAAYKKALGLVRAGFYDEALAVELLPSDRNVIERKVEAAKMAAGANRRAE